MVYRALRNPDRTPVILKVVDSHAPGPRDRARLENEREIGGSLDPRFSIGPLALDTHQGMPALVLPDLGLQSLDRFLGGPMEIGRFLALAVRIAECVQAVHRQGVVHKDLKPENLLVDGEGRVRITDFGLASRLTREQAAQAPRLIEGSLPYMSPEQTGRMNRAVDFRTDLYSLGVTFYEMLTGKLPFQARDPMEWVHCHVARPVPVLDESSGVPEMIGRIVAKLLAKMPEDRYQTARGLRHDLQRCRDQWQARGAIEPFALSERDVSGRLCIPQSLYGRDQDVSALMRAHDRVARQGTSELLLVLGYSGIGKSALVQELYKPVVRSQGFFAQGKFDPYQREVPYSTFVQALRELALELLAASEEQIATWRERLLGALGVNARLITDVIPQVELLIGPQPPVPELPPAEAQNRFRIVFRQFIGAFAREAHPLVLFLDDLQWADSGSLGLLKELVTHPEMRFLLVVGAYRDNEVGPAHPLTWTLEEARKEEARISEIVLGPLSLEDLAAFVGDALWPRRDDVWTLATLLLEKTGGNPFFAIQFLTALHEEGLLVFDARAGGWGWDLDRIRAKGFTDNVVDLMASKLMRLPRRTQSALMRAAALGSTGEIAILALVLGRSEAETKADLWEGFRVGLLLRSGETSYAFLHDRVHEAAYALIAEATRPLVHLRIGRILVSLLPKEVLFERVFEVASQLNRGAGLIQEPRERALLCELNFAAGKKARAATAFASARSYLSQALALLPPDAWREQYADTYALHLSLAECEYLVGNFAQADALFDLILSTATSRNDLMTVHGLRSRLYQLAGRFEESVNAAFEGLRLFGVPIPQSAAELQAATEAELAQIPVNLGGRRIADLIDSPPVTDPDVALMLSFMSEFFAPTYIARPEYMPWLAAKAVNLSLRYGNQAESAHAYSTYAVMLVSGLGDISTALAYSELALRLNETLDDRKLRGRLLVIHANFVQFWCKPFATVMPYLDRALLANLEVGDLVWHSYLAFTIAWMVFEKGDSLDEVLSVSRQCASFGMHHHNDVVNATIRLEQQFVANLKGWLPTPARFDDETFNEEAFLKKITGAAFRSGILKFHLTKQIAAFTYGLYAEALDAAHRGADSLASVRGMALEATYHFYLALTLTALYPGASAQEREAYTRTLNGILPRLKGWADDCPENYLNRYALVSAEVARIQGRDFEAARLYEEAIRSAGENGLVQNQALAYELGSAFYRERRFEAFADAYWNEARGGYARWGADGKVRQMDQQRPRPREQRPVSPSATFAVPPEQLDLLSVVKASQALSGELVEDQLVRTLLRVVLEQSGAQKGYLVVARGGELRVEAEAHISEEKVRTGLALPLDPARLPISIVRYAERTRERVILDDAMAAPRFASDPYVVRARPRSILCLPVFRKAERAAFLYLENDLVEGAFTPDRLTALEILASQAAIALENARLYRETQEAVRLREEFLIVAAHELYTPMTSLKLSLQSMSKLMGPERMPDPEAMGKQIALALRQGDRMTGLIKNLLDVSRIEAGKLPLERSAVDLLGLVREVAQRFEPDLLRAGSHLTLTGEAPVLGIWDRSHIDQVVTNLLGNAVKFGANRPIEVAVGKKDGIARLAVTDHGIGMDPFQQDRLFHRFERGVSARHYGGLGLGLYVSKRIVEAHGGSIRVRSQPGAGATFTVELPCAEQAAEAPASALSSAAIH